MALRHLGAIALCIAGIVQASPVAANDATAIEGLLKRDASDKSGNVHFHLGCHGGLYPVNEGIDQTFHYHGITVTDPDGTRSAECKKNRNTTPVELDCTVSSPYLAQEKVPFALQYNTFNCNIINLQYCGRTYGSNMDIPECGNSAHAVPGTDNEYADCYIHGCSGHCSGVTDAILCASQG